MKIVFKKVLHAFRFNLFQPFGIGKDFLKHPQLGLVWRLRWLDITVAIIAVIECFANNYAWSTKFKLNLHKKFKTRIFEF